MAQLDRMNGYVNPDGRETGVIEQVIEVRVGLGSALFQIFICLVGFIPAAYCYFTELLTTTQCIILAVLGFVPAIGLAIKKVQVKNYFNSLTQRLNSQASTIDNYIEQRVIILKNAKKLLDQAVSLDKDTFVALAAQRSGSAGRNELNAALDNNVRAFNMAFENYPELRAHSSIAEAMKQNDILQRQITAARELYNDTINMWNKEIFAWPIKMIVASSERYKTEIPFSTSREIKDEAKSVLF